MNTWSSARKGVEEAREYRGDVNLAVEGEHTGLTEAAKSGQAGVAAMLIREKGARVDLIDGEGYLPLHLGVFSEHTKVVRMLGLEQGADPEQLDGFGNTAMMWASTPEMVRLLVGEMRADPNPPGTRKTAPHGVKVLEELCRAGWGAGREADLARLLDSFGMEDLWLRRRRA